MDDKLINRLDSKIQTGPSCWMWLDKPDSYGYGQLNYNKQTLKGHKLVYELLVGPVPAGLFLDHLCHNRDSTCPGGKECRHRRCVNPDHLLPSTDEENKQRAKDRRKTCSNGHVRTDENTYVYPSGGRKCRECHAATSNARYHRKKDQT